MRLFKRTWMGNRRAKSNIQFRRGKQPVLLTLTFEQMYKFTYSTLTQINNKTKQV